VDFDGRLAVLRVEGERLADAASRAGFDAPVPTCPGWSVRDLVRHIGGIHRWAATMVREARPKPFDPYPELEKAWPADAELLAWFRAGHIELVRVLEAAPADLDCFSVLRIDPPRDAWARRQAHETGMHRVDAESASGSITAFAADQAVDGIEEMLFGFATRPGSRLTCDPPRSISLSTTDARSEWTVHIAAEGPRAERGTTAAADCRVSATASNLFLLLWNRIGVHAVQVEGDPSVLDLWRDTVQVRWR
jgi:uncharacterized protein (TIGR03083 family)